MHLLAIGSQPLKMLSQHSVKLITYLANLDSYSSAVQLIYIASSQLLPEKLWCSVFHAGILPPLFPCFTAFLFFNPYNRA